jgi:hypothetical protein
MIYQYNSEAVKNIVKVPAQKVGERLERIRAANNGDLTKEAVVEDARSTKSPLHKIFEWDNDVAAEKFRLEQARFLIKSISVVVSEEQTAPVRAFVNVRGSNTSAYTSMSDAMSDPQLRALVLDRARRELEDWRARYRHLEEFADIIDMINSVTSKAASTRKTKVA